MSNVDDEAVANDAKELIRMCRAGRLYEIERWIADGKSLNISEAIKRGRQKSLLEIAVEVGFHSLVELIAKNETSQSAKDSALHEAVSSRRLDLVELLLANAADIKAVRLADVLLTWEPKLIRLFLDHGADCLEGRPFAEAFGAKVRTALRPFLDYKQTHPELAPQLQEQLDCALRYFCGEGDLKWVSLLMWAGSDPRSRGPCLRKEYTEDPECYTSGLQEACGSENLEVLKKLKLDPKRDDLTELLHSAAIWGRKPTLEYLLQVGANPNDKANGGSSALDTALRDLNFARLDPYGSKRLKSRYDVSRVLDCVRELLVHGAIWNPQAYDLTSLRRTLLECEPDVTIELLQMFRKHNACPAERVHALLGTPRMKEHLKVKTDALSRLGIHLDSRPKLSGHRQSSRAQQIH
jgi:ankyrin repeat protein